MNPLKSTVPLGTHILLVGSMLVFFAVATLVTLQAGWQWWLIPAAIAVPMAVVLTQRISKVGKARDVRLALEADRRAGRGTPAGPETAGRAGSSR